MECNETQNTIKNNLTISQRFYKKQNIFRIVKTSFYDSSKFFYYLNIWTFIFVIYLWIKFYVIFKFFCFIGKCSQKDDNDDIEIIEPKTDLINLDSDEDDKDESSSTNTISDNNSNNISVKISEIDDKNQIKRYNHQQQIRTKIDHNLLLRLLANQKFANHIQIKRISGSVKGIKEENVMAIKDSDKKRFNNITYISPTNQSAETTLLHNSNQGLFKVSLPSTSQRRQTIDVSKNQPRKKLTNKPNPTLIKQMQLIKREQKNGNNQQQENKTTTNNRTIISLADIAAQSIVQDKDKKSQLLLTTSKGSDVDSCRNQLPADEKIDSIESFEQTESLKQLSEQREGSDGEEKIVTTSEIKNGEKGTNEKNSNVLEMTSYNSASLETQIEKGKDKTLIICDESRKDKTYILTSSTPIRAVQAAPTNDLVNATAISALIEDGNNDSSKLADKTKLLEIESEMNGIGGEIKKLSSKLSVHHSQIEKLETPANNEDNFKN